MNDTPERTEPSAPHLVVVAGPREDAREVAIEIARAIGATVMSTSTARPAPERKPIFDQATQIAARSMLRQGFSIVVEGDYEERGARLTALQTADAAVATAGVVLLAEVPQHGVAMHDGLAGEDWAWHAICAHVGGRWQVRYVRDPHGVLARLGLAPS